MLLHLKEADKCLGCKNARCQKNCPINTPIPEIIKLYKENKLEEAGKILFENNPLSCMCALVCPHEKQCRGYCIKGIKSEPVRFHEIEFEISSAYLKNLKLEVPKKNGHKVAIVGSGPAGITAALELAKKGYDITIFEKNDKIGGILTYGIPEFRLAKSYIQELYKRLLELGIKFRLNASVGPVITLDKLFEDGYKSIFIGTGVWNPRKLNIPGETFGNVHYAIDYLRSPMNYNLGDNVVVIGAGNVAMDAARSAKYYGSKNVGIFYRRGFENMSATKDEIEDAKNDDISFNIHKSPTSIVDQGIYFTDTQNIKNEDGSINLVTIENSEKLYKCDSILIAVGQSARNTIVKNNPGLELTKYGLLQTDEKGHTTRKGVFASGDVAHGAATVIDAVVAAKKVASSIDEYIKSTYIKKRVNRYNVVFSGRQAPSGYTIISTTPALKSKYFKIL